MDEEKLSEEKSKIVKRLKELSKEVAKCGAALHKLRESDHGDAVREIAEIVSKQADCLR